MTEQPHPEKLPPETPVSASKVKADAPPLEIGQPAPVDELSPEEQMALFEKDLKEKDWGHQPC